MRSPWSVRDTTERRRVDRVEYRHLARIWAPTGKMTLKGRTQEITAPFTFTPQGKDGLFEGAFVLKRGDFAIGEGPWADFGTVANEVQIRFRLLAAAK